MEIDREEIQMVAKRILMLTTYEYANEIIDELGSEIVDDVIETADENWCDDDVRLAIGRTILKRIGTKSEKEPEVKKKVMVDIHLFAMGDQWGAVAKLEDGTDVPIWAVNGNDPREIPPWETSESEYEMWYNTALEEAHAQGFVLKAELKGGEQ